MKRNWYAAIILLALCVLLFRAGQYVDRTTAGMQRQLEAAYALAEQGDYPAARRAYSRAANRALRSTHPMELYRISRDNPAKLPGWRRYVYPIYTTYNGKCRKDALPMKF